MKQLIFSAKTVEAAVEKAAAELSVSVDALKYEVVSEGKKGLFSSKDAEIRVLTSDKKKRVETFLKEVIENFPLYDVNVEVEADDECVSINITGEEASYLIGRRGDTLNALQYLCGLIVNNGEEKYSRVSLNINAYREKREKTLEALAKRLANQAIRTGKSVTLEPMAPYERRIIHSTVQKIEHVESSSIGTEPNRRVVITSDGTGRKRHDSRRDNNRRGRKLEDRRKEDNSESLIKDDFLTSSSTIEGLKKEKEIRDAQLPLYTKIEL